MYLEGQSFNKQLLDKVSMVCGITKIQVNVISRAVGEADNTYRSYCMITWDITETEFNKYFILLISF